MVNERAGRLRIAQPSLKDRSKPQPISGHSAHSDISSAIVVPISRFNQIKRLAQAAPWHVRFSDRAGPALCPSCLVPGERRNLGPPATIDDFPGLSILGLGNPVERYPWVFSPPFHRPKRVLNPCCMAERKPSGKRIGWRMSASRAPTKKLKMIPFMDFPFVCRTRWRATLKRMI